MYLIKSIMDKAKLEFTLNGRKHTFFRRFDLFNKPLTTTNINNAKLIKESELKNVIKLLTKTYGVNNIKDFNPIKE